MSLSPSHAKLLQYYGLSFLRLTFRYFFRGLILAATRQDRPNGPGIIIGTCDGNYIWVPPVPHTAKPQASGVLKHVRSPTAATSAFAVIGPIPSILPMR